MATVEFAFLSPASGTLDSAYPSSRQNLTSSASNQVTTAAAGNSEACVVTCVGGSVYVSFAAAPDASSDPTKRLVLDGQTRTFQVSAGHKGALIDA